MVGRRGGAADTRGCGEGRGVGSAPPQETATAAAVTAGGQEQDGPRRPHEASASAGLRRNRTRLTRLRSASTTSTVNPL